MRLGLVTAILEHMNFEGVIVLPWLIA